MCEGAGGRSGEAAPAPTCALHRQQLPLPAPVVALRPALRDHHRRVGFDAQKQTAAPVRNLVDPGIVGHGAHRDQPPVLMVCLIAFVGTLRDHRPGRPPGFVDLQNLPAAHVLWKI